MDFLETFYLLNLLLFSIGTFYVTITNGDQVTLANTSVTIVFITFLVTVFHHLFVYCVKRLNIYRRVTAVVRSILLSIPKKKNSNNEDEPNLETSTVHMHLLREPALDEIAPISSCDYNPPPVVPAPCPVTSTTVSIAPLQKECSETNSGKQE